jgi:uncharacterized protein YuzB (UPF0349 family)
MKIQICRKFSKVSKLQKKLTEAFPYDVIIIKKCISMCKACKTQPVAKVAGKKLKAKSIPKIIDKIENI